MKSKLTRLYTVSLLMISGLLVNVGAFAQTRTVSGKVLGENGAPVSSATVNVKGTKISVVADEYGFYHIKVPTGDATLVFSYVGYNPFEEKVGETDEHNITLHENKTQLNEIVVTALGVKKEAKRIGYSTQEVKGSDLVKAREPNAINSLTGKVAGLTVGASAEMLGRPQVVLRGSTDLLFVVDGVPVNSDTWNMSADDIESYTVLKGANAAALYGFRGQNGAILVTTKKGSKEKRGFTVEFNSSTMFEKGYTALPKNQTEYGYGNNYKYAYGNDLYDLDGSYRRSNIWGPRFEGQPVKQYDSPIDQATGQRTGTPWVARGVNNFENFMETGLLSTNNIAVSASGDKYDLRMSYSHTYQKGMAPNTKLNIDNLNINTGYNFSPKLRMEANLNFNAQYTPNIPDVSYGPNSYPYMFKVYGSASWALDDMKDYWKGPTGRPGLVQYYAEYGRENNPYFVAHEWLHGHYKTDVYGYLKFTYKVNKDLNISLRSQVTTWNQFRTEKVPPSTNLNAYYSGYYFQKNGPLYSIWYGDYREDKRMLIENNTDLMATYNKRLSKSFTLNAVGGASIRTFKYNSDWASTYQLTIPGVYNLSNSKNPVKAYTFGSNMQVISGYASVDLSYKNYLNVSATGRVDKLSTLPESQQTIFYPSLGVSSVISDYSKLPEAISFLKVRGSFADVKGGLTNSTIGSAYNALTTSVGNPQTLNSGLLGYGSELYTSYDGPSYTNQMAYNTTTFYNNTPSITYSNTLANKDLKSFDIKSYEAGLDVKFLKNRLGLDVTYFRTINGPLIYPLPVASSTGYYSHNVNGITSQKDGFEVSLVGTPVRTKDFSWDIMVNWSTYKEKLKDIYQNEKTVTINDHNYHIGDRLDAFYGYKVFRAPDGQPIYNSSGLLLEPKTGTDNKQLLGYANPDYVFGINNRFSYKNFSFSFQVDGRVGGKIYDYVFAQSMNSGNALDLVQGDYGAARLNEWKSTNLSTVDAKPAYVGKGVVITSGIPVYENGAITNLDQLKFEANKTPVTVQNYVQNSLYAKFDEPFLISRSYLKLREVVLGYTFPAEKFHGKFLKGASVSLVGRNLLYFAERKDIDLDQYASGFNISDRSLNSKPGLQSTTARRFGFNVNLSF
jgi:TonB-linked SusC/RagA family outer membrane protein